MTCIWPRYLNLIRGWRVRKTQRLVRAWRLSKGLGIVNYSLQFKSVRQFSKKCAMIKSNALLREWFLKFEPASVDMV